MKKLTAMLLSLMMCFSLLTIPARTGVIPNPDGPIVVEPDEPKDPADPGDDDPDDPGISVQYSRLPDEADETPID